MGRSFASGRTFATGRVQRTNARWGGGGGQAPPDPAPTIVSGPTLVSKTTTAITLTWTADQFVQSWLEYGTTTSYGSESTHETSFDYKTHQQTISSLTPGTTYHFRPVVVNQDGIQTIGSDIAVATDSESSSNSMYVPTFYGSGNSDSRANIRTASGADAMLVSFRFIASTSSALNSVQWQQRGGSGYSLGTGGTYRLTLRADDGSGNPGTVLATATDYSPGNPGTFEKLDTITFPSPYTVTAGVKYHIVFDNVHASEASNYISINCSYTYNTLTPRQPGYTQDFAVMRTTNGTTWSVMSNYTANVEIAYADGTFDGYGYNGINIDAVKTVTGSNNMIRELFTVSGGTRTVTEAWVRVGRQSGTGLLTLALYTGAGSIMAFGSAADSGSSVGLTTVGGTGTQGTWCHIEFGTPQTLTNGQQYFLRLSCAAGTQYSMTPLSHGINNPSANLSSKTFTDGIGQYTTNGGSSWSAIYAGFASPGHSNTQFYFVTT